MRPFTFLILLLLQRLDETLLHERGRPRADTLRVLRLEQRRRRLIARLRRTAAPSLATGG